MPDYSQGKIYKITSSQTKDIYVGSTTALLNKRFEYHINNNRNAGICSSKHLLKFDDCKIELIEEYPCENHLELREREQYFMDLLDNVINKQRAVAKLGKERQAEYRERNPDKVKESYNNWRENHLEQEANRQAIYFANNKEVLKNKHRKRNVKIKCEYCENEIGKYQLPRHLKNCKLIPK